MENLYKIASHTSNALQHQAANLKEELNGLEDTVEEKKLQLQNTLRSLGRAESFESKIDNEFQCAQCWIQGGLRISLKPIPSDENEDHFRCQSCYSEYLVKP